MWTRCSHDVTLNKFGWEESNKKIEKGTQPSGGTADAWRVTCDLKSEFNRRRMKRKIMLMAIFGFPVTTYIIRRALFCRIRFDGRNVQIRRQLTNF